MNFKIGDFVRFVDEAIEGHITSFLNDDIIGVTDESGFEIPVSVNKITAVHGDMKRQDDEDSPAPVVGEFVEKGIYLAVTGEPKDGLAKFWLVNETSFQLLISIGETQSGKQKGHFAALLSPSKTVEFHKANFSAVGKWPTFSIRIIRHANTLHTSQPILEEEVRIKPISLSDPKTRLDLLAEKAWVIQLDIEKKDIGIQRLKDFGK
ncbi:hypothetical protein M8998_09755 [Sphingobacterium sp. lm-10]|uniref:hypothetical protein n=1 Tax=Sphingobacterium sp. lm-10 TaxID=2944904 RepID=UPI00202024B7|nr:hypothetical protein [Sphingobacterium sp. lm-10]MCL7988221.1 hypothetical protein [Sphingobacterium sp. lm-10]